MKKKILVVDDDRGILDALTFTLETSGYDVQSTSKGTKAYEMVQRYHPDVILLDVLLSGIDGRDICRKLKANGQRKTPVIMFSAKPDVKKSVEQAGADAFLAKPFEISELLDRVQQYIE